MRCGEYGKETEKSAKYMKQPAAQEPAVYNAGNHSRQFTIQVPVLNADGTIKLDENGMIIGEEVTGRYEWYQTHRNKGITPLLLMLIKDSISATAIIGQEL